MTAKDYRALAATLARTQPDIEARPYTSHSAIGHNTMVDHISYNAAHAAWTATRDGIADVLAADNPRFDRGRFIAATLEVPA